MAGVGFELRKIFKQDTIKARIKGSVYATITTIGPTIIFVMLLLTIRLVLNALQVSEKEQLFFSSSLLYLFIIANMISGALNTIITRFLSDMLFQQKEEYIPATLFGTIITGAVLTAILELPISLILYHKHHISPTYLLGYYLFGIMITVSYFIFIFISAIKEYAKITKAYAVGITSSVGIFLILHYTVGLPVIDGIIISLAISFLIINVLLIYYVLIFFQSSNHQFFAFTSYFKLYPKILFSGLFYGVGLYLPNVIYWYWSDISVEIAGFHVAPAYDMATFLAVMINISSAVIFTVKVETDFYEKYKIYVNAINSSNYATIEKARKNMVNTININLFFIYEIQLIITIILMCIGVLVLPLLGAGGMQEDYFLLLGIAYYAIFSLNYTVIFLYYFQDQPGAFRATGIFLLATAVAVLLSLKLGSEYYAVAPLVGAVLAWIYAFFRLKYILKDITANIFCGELE